MTQTGHRRECKPSGGDVSSSFPIDGLQTAFHTVYNVFDLIILEAGIQGQAQTAGIIQFRIRTFAIGVVIFFSVIGLPINRNVMNLRKNVFLVQPLINLTPDIASAGKLDRIQMITHVLVCRIGGQNEFFQATKSFIVFGNNLTSSFLKKS